MTTPPDEQMVAAASTEFPPLDYGKEYISKERQWEHSGQHKGFTRCWEQYVVPLRAENERLVSALHRIAITDDADCKHATDPEWMKRIARDALRTLAGDE